MQKGPELGVANGLEALRRFLVGDDDLRTMLTKITLIATDAVPGADMASITMITDGRPKTPVFTHKTALELDEKQYELGDGPCLAAARHQGVELVDTAADHRWPSFSEAALAKGVTATLSAPMVDGDVVRGALNLYSTTTFDADAAEAACLYADQLGVAAAKVVFYVDNAVMNEQLRTAMLSRAVIEQAKGILMAAEHCDADAAFAILTRASQNRNRKLREVAEEIVARRSGGEPGSLQV